MNKWYKRWGVVIDQIQKIYPADRKELQEKIFELYKAEYEVDKDRKRDLTDKEWWQLVNFTLGWFAIEKGIYLLAPGEKETKNLFNEDN